MQMVSKPNYKFNVTLGSHFSLGFTLHSQTIVWVIWKVSQPCGQTQNWIYSPHPNLFASDDRDGGLRGQSTPCVCTFPG